MLDLPLEQVQSFDQEFENMNKALKLSCIKGLPVRVVRSFKVSTWQGLPSPSWGGRDCTHLASVPQRSADSPTGRRKHHPQASEAQTCVHIWVIPLRAAVALPYVHPLKCPAAALLAAAVLIPMPPMLALPSHRRSGPAMRPPLTPP